MPATEHTWTTAERQAARRFARSLPDERLETARDLTGRAAASAEEVVDVLAKHKQELSRVAGTFRINKPDIVKFLRTERPNKADLRLTVLSNTSPEELKAVLESYFTQVAPFRFSKCKLSC